ncbi:MAG TPA: tRNA lysidine(34) synthetase TilS, partial [Rhodopila sp.]
GRTSRDASSLMSGIRSHLASAFAATMRDLGPFEPQPALAIAVSGGADSMALAILAAEWTQRRNGSIAALVVDHGLRFESGAEALLTIDRLLDLGIPGRLLRIRDLKPGSALAERARIARYDVLTAACREAGVLHLLLGHHEADQVETLAMRVLRGSQTAGLAGISALREAGGVRLLRPLLGVHPALLRRYLTARAVEWVEDPSNQNIRATRSRLRRRLADETAQTEVASAMQAVARLRAREEAAIAAELARRATIRPEGFVLLSPGRIGRAALSRLFRMVGGAPYPPSPAQINDFAAQPRPATVAGVRVARAGKFGDGLLMAREEAAISNPVPVRAGAIWDHRFRLSGCLDTPAGAMIGKLGDDAALFRAVSDLPSVVLRTLPAIRVGKFLAAAPHLGYAADGPFATITLLFDPPGQAAGPCFVTAGGASEAGFDFSVVIRDSLVDDECEAGM